MKTTEIEDAIVESYGLDELTDGDGMTVLQVETALDMLLVPRGQSLTLKDNLRGKLRKKMCHLVYVPGSDNRQAHFLGVYNLEDYALVLDSYGRSMEDVLDEHDLDNKVLSYYNFMTVTGNYQADATNVCGEYVCIFASLLHHFYTLHKNLDEATQQLSDVLDKLFIDKNKNIRKSLTETLSRREAELIETHMIAVYNDIRCLHAFQGMVDIDKLPNNASLKSLVSEVSLF